MPARNPWLTDSVYPTSHFNPGATDSVLFAGPTKGKKLELGKDVKLVPNIMSSNPTVKKIGSDTVLFASGTLGIKKILATGTEFKELSFMPYPGLEEVAKQVDDKGLKDILGDFDAARRAHDGKGDEAQILAAVGRVGKLGCEHRDRHQRRLQLHRAYVGPDHD